MIFLAVLLIKIVLSTCTSLLLIRILNPIIQNTTQKMFVKDLQISWLKYIQIAFFVLGLTSGINLYSMRDFIIRTNKNLTFERLIAEGWDSIVGSSLAIITAMLILFFVFLIITYLNQLAVSNKPAEKKVLKDAAIVKKESVDINSES